MIISSLTSSGVALGRFVLAIALCLAAAWPSAWAAAVSGDTAVIDPARLEALIDAAMADHLERYAIAGASIAIVHDGEVVLSKGYGHADLAAGTAVDPDTTLFAAGSVTKLLTWLAVMQLVEQGSIDLQADVNTYLSALRVPDTFAEPVRVWHLLSHTAGFEDGPIVGLFSRSAVGLPTLEQALARAMPARLWESGRYTAYSNYSTALAAQIVAEVSGMPWEAYLEAHILEPLGMTHATTRQPVPQHLAADLSRVYTSVDGTLVEGEFEFVPLAPAGGMTASASDMARFMLAHLQDGRLGDIRVLGEATARQMRTRLFSHDPSLPGNAYGFWEGVANGQRVLSHGGDTMLSHTMLALLPDHDLGFFVAYNSAEGAAAREELWRAFMDELFPRGTEPAPEVAVDAQQIARFAGSYSFNRTSATTIGKLGALFSSLEITVQDGLLVLGAGDRQVSFREAGPNSFAALDSDARLLFRDDSHGKVSQLFISEMPMLVAVPTTWHAGLPFQGGMFAAAVLVSVSALLALPLLARSARRRGRPSPRPSRFARWWGAATCGAFVVFFVLFALSLPNPLDIVYGLTSLTSVALVVGVAAAVMAGATAALAVVAWRRSYWSLGARVHYSLVALAGLALTWQLNYWNALGIRV